MKRGAMHNGFVALLVMGSLGYADEAKTPMREPDGESAAQKERRQKEIAEAKKIVAEATKAIDNSPKVNPKEESQHFAERADAWMTLGEFRKAYDDYDTAIVMQSPETLVGPSLHLFQWRFIAAMRMGDYPRALTEIEALTEDSVSPDPVAFAYLAIILARSPHEKVRDPARAKVIAKYAAHLQKSPRDLPIVELALAAALSVNGDFEGALKHQERAIKAMKEQEGDVSEEAKLQLEAYRQQKEFPLSPAQADRDVEK